MGVWGRGSSSGPNWSPGLLDRAETFAESAVTLSHDETERAAEAIELYPAATDSSSPGIPAPPADNFSQRDCGIVINPNVDLDRVQITLSPNNGGDAAGAGVRESDGTLIGSVDGPISPGETVTIDAQMTAGTEYHVQGFDVPSPARDGSPGYPHTSEGADAVAGSSYASSTRQADRLWAISSLTVLWGVPEQATGSAVIEWPMPADLAGWDIIPYESTEDGGTVEVYAVDPSDGTRLTAALEDPGDISDLPRSTNVAVEVVLSRASKSENPRLEAVYRRRKIT